MRHLICASIVLSLLVQPAMADEKSKVKGILKEKIDAVIGSLRDKETDKKVRDDKIIEMVTPIFDFKLMGKLSLGKKYWPGLNKEERKTYSDLYTKRLQESYLDKMGLYSDENLIYEEPIEKGKKIHAPVRLVSKDNDLLMLYKFYKSKVGDWKIYDVELEGVSVIQTYRSQFHDVMKDGTIQDLIAKLEKTGEFSIPDTEKDE